MTSGALIGAGLILCSLSVPTTGVARPHRTGQIPNNIWDCSACHTSDFSVRTAFGEDVNATLAGNDVDWARVCGLDSDGDGATNGAELGDPSCAWMIGAPNPEAEITDPNDAESFPMAPPMEPPMGGAEPPAGGEEPPAGGGEPPAGGEEPPAEPPAGGGEPPMSSPDAGVDGGDDAGEEGCSQTAGSTTGPLIFLFALLALFTPRRERVKTSH